MGSLLGRIAIGVWIVAVALAPHAFVRANEADDQYAVAAGHYARQQWKLAVDELQAFLKKYPNDRHANECVFLCGEALLQTGRLDEARENFQKYLSREPSGARAQAALFRVGEAAYLAGNFAIAKPDLERFLAQYPKHRLNGYVLPYLGDTVLAGGDAVAAAGYFQEGLKQFADGPLQDDCRLGLGRALEKQKKLEEAEQFYAAVAGKSGSTLADVAQFQLGALQYAAGRYDRAVESFSPFEKRLSASPWQPNARLGLALALLKLNRTAEAVKQFDAVLATASAGDELFQQAARGKIQAALESKDYAGVDRGAAEFQKRFPKSPLVGDVQRMVTRSLSEQDVDALLAAAQLREQRKQFAEAAASYQRLAKEHPQYAKLDIVLYQWAWVLQALKRPDDAAQLFQQLHSKYPQSRFWADATYRLAERARDVKDYDRALTLVDSLLGRKTAGTGSEAPNAAGVREYAMFLRGQIFEAKGDWPKAREAFAAFVKEFPQSRRRLVAEFWMAESLYRQGDRAAAGREFARLAGQIPKDRESWMAMIPLRYAQVLAQQKQWIDAQAVASKIAADFPGFEQQYEVDYLLGRCLANRADFEGARQAYNRVIVSPTGAKTETAARAQWMIGESYLHQKNDAAALKAYLRVEILYAYPTWQAAALLQAGKCREHLGESKEAADLYQRLVKSYPKTAFSDEAVERLKHLGTALSGK
jgi:cellulose synthase operon protein C